MPTDTRTSILDRVWNRLEERYDTEDVGCGCGASGNASAVLERSALTREDVEAYRRGERTMTDLVEKVDADLDPAAIDDLPTLVEELGRALGVTDSRERVGTTG